MVIVFIASITVSFVSIDSFTAIRENVIVTKANKINQ